MTQSRSFTATEAQDMIIDTVASIADEYAVDPDLSAHDKCHGVAFSILAALDGTRTGMPGVDLVLRTGEGDVERARQNGESYFEDGMVINTDRNLHLRYDQLRQDMAANIAPDDTVGMGLDDDVETEEGTIPF